MASANSTFTELVTTTFRRHRKGFKDNLSERNAFLKKIYKKGNYRTEEGGLSIVEPLDYAQNSTYQRYSDWDLLNIQQSDVLSAAEFTWKQIAMHIVASGRELRINSGPAQIEKLVAARLKNAFRTFDNNFSSLFRGVVGQPDRRDSEHHRGHQHEHGGRDRCEYLDVLAEHGV